MYNFTFYRYGQVGLIILGKLIMNDENNLLTVEC